MEACFHVYKDFSTLLWRLMMQPFPPRRGHKVSLSITLQYIPVKNAETKPQRGPRPALWDLRVETLAVFVGSPAWQPSQRSQCHGA